MGYPASAKLSCAVCREVVWKEEQGKKDLEKGSADIAQKPRALEVN